MPPAFTGDFDAPWSSVIHDPYETTAHPALDNDISVFPRDIIMSLREGSLELADLDLEKSKVLAKLVSVTYCSNETVIQAWSCTRCKRVPSFKIYKVVFDTSWDLLAYVGWLPEDNAIVAAFRGTDNKHLGNWLENLRSWTRSAMYMVPEAQGAKVHAGFHDLWVQSRLQADVMAAIGDLMKRHPGARLYVAGHSMGAALAQLCALDARFQLGIAQVHSFTFGSPRVGNVAFQKLFDQEMETSWRFTHNRDVVPSLPPTLFGYHHVAREVWTVDVEPLMPGGQPEQQVVVCDATGEDPHCHNSACLLGLCTSILDHLKYLQFEMYHAESEC